MAGKSSGFAIGFGIQDNASAGIDAINRRIAALTAPADRFNRSLQKFGDVSGIARAAEGVQTLGDRALGAARAVERLAGPMAGITSAASLAGMVEMTRRWAEAGNQIARTSGALNTPVSRLSALRGAARLAGGSAEALDGSLKGLGDRLAEAKWKGGPIRSLFNEFHVGFEGVNGMARTGADALGEVAEAVTRLTDPHAQVRLLDQFGISADLLPMLNKGRKGLEDFLATAERTGGVMTAEMAANATAMNKAWNELGLAIEGVGNRIVNSWSGTATKVLDTTAHWVENNKKLADSYAQDAAAVVSAVGLLAGLRVAPWILRALGLVGPSSPYTVPLMLSGDSGPGSVTQTPEQIEATRTYAQEHARPWSDFWPGVWRWLWGSPGASKPLAGPRAGPRAMGAAEPLVPYQGGAILQSMHISAGEYGAFREGIARIEHARYNQMGGAGGRFAGRYQMGEQEIAETARRLFVPVPTRAAFLGDPAMQERFFEAYSAGHHEQLMRESAEYRALSPEERLAVLGYAHNQGVGGAEAWLRTGQVGRDAFRTPGTDFSDSVAANLRAALGGGGSTGSLVGASALGGTVRVDVHLHGAPAGTTASAAGTGAVAVTPLNIQTSMPLAR